jgi:hypothetical protein
MPRFDVVVEEQGRSVRTAVYEYEAPTREEALMKYNNGEEAVWAWVDTDDFVDETHETIVDIRPVEDANA